MDKTLEQLQADLEAAKARAKLAEDYAYAAEAAYKVTATFNAAWAEVAKIEAEIKMLILRSMVMSRRAKRPTAWAMYEAECERRGMKVLYVDNDSTCVQGLSYYLIMIDEFVDVVKEQDK